jgi:hypothetical protein
MNTDQIGRFEKVPPPPRLHWVIVLVLSVVTLGFFADVWFIVQAVWVKKFDPASRALPIYVAGFVLSLAGEVMPKMGFDTPMVAVVWVGAIALDLVGSFNLRDSLAAYLSNLEGKRRYLSGTMTIFLGPIYFQYHMNRIRSAARARA